MGRLAGSRGRPKGSKNKIKKILKDEENPDYDDHGSLYHWSGNQYGKGLDYSSMAWEPCILRHPPGYDAM